MRGFFYPGSSNIIIGALSGSINSGNNNIFMGNGVASNGVTGGYNVAIGERAYFAGGIGSNNICLGNAALTSESNGNLSTYRERFIK